MKKTRLFIALVGVLLILTLALTLAHENFTETKELIDSKIDCNELNNEQLEEIGDYYMEQMHPGEAHEIMHKMMGGEDSETVRQMHIQMAKSIYCGESGSMMSMMNMMTNDMQSGMMGGMMNGIYRSYGNYNAGFVFLNWMTYILIIALIIATIYWLIKTADKKR